MLLVVGASIQGLAHLQNLEFLRTNAPSIYAFITGEPFHFAMWAVALAFIAAGCFGIWRQRKHRQSQSLYGAEPHSVTLDHRLVTVGDVSDGSTVVVGSNNTLGVLRNDKAEIAVTILDAWIMRSSYIIGIQKSGIWMQIRDEYITVVFDLFNAGRKTTVDEWVLSAIGDSFGEITAHSLLLRPTPLHTALHMPAGVQAVKRNIKLPRGQTITRYDHFAFQTETETQDEPPKSTPAPDQTSSIRPDRLAGMTLTLTVRDSYGKAWLSPPWSTQQPQASSAQP